MAEQIIADATAASSLPSTGLHVEPDEVVTAILTGTLGAAETIPVAVSYDGGSNFSAYSSGGAAVALTLTNTAIRLFGPAIYQFQKGITVGACGVAVSTRDSM